MKLKQFVFIAIVSEVGMLAMSGCGCDTSEQTGSLNGHGYVDLGLPSGTLWATCNIGADDPNDAGDYFSYGKTTSWSEEDMRNYSYSPSIIPQEYIRDFDVFHVCFLELHPDILDLYLHFSTLNKSDDAATYNWGDAWRMPTKEDCEELMSECGWEWISHNFQKGYKVTGPNGNSIFLPTTGYQSIMAGIPLLGILWPGTSEEGNGYYRMSSCFWGEIDSEKGWSSPVLFLGETPDSPIEINFTPAANAGVPIRPVYSPSSAGQTISNKKKNVKSDEEIKQEAKEFVLNCYKNYYADYYDETIYSNELKQARRNWRKSDSRECNDAEDIFYDRKYDDGCGSWCDKENINHNVDDVYLISDDKIKVSISYTYKVYSAYDDNEFIANVNHKDEFTLIKENDRWVIDDLVRDGVSSKDAYRRNDKRFGRDCC
jgi:hypothetical protein